MARIPKKVISRFSKETARYQKILMRAKARDVNESDTVTILTDMLEDLFGYDKYAEITSEQAIRGTFCDLAVKIDGKVKFLIEAKAVGMTLKDNHLRQAVGYGASAGIPWIVLTNGVEWEIHRIRFEKPIVAEHVCTLDFLTLAAKNTGDQAKLFLLCREGAERAAIEEFHEHQQTVNRYIIAAIARSESVLGAMRREMRKNSPGTKISVEEIEKILISEVLKREVVEGQGADEARKQLKKWERKVARKALKRKKDPDESAGPEDSPVE